MKSAPLPAPLPEPITETFSRRPAGLTLVELILAGRVPAPASFLERRLAAADSPAPGSLAWALAICRAEIDWSVADWRRLDPLDPGPSRDGWGAHPSEACRLPHEHAAAAVLNAAAHLHPTSWRLRELVRRHRPPRDRTLGRLRAQREAAINAALTEAWRFGWRERAHDTVEELRALWTQRRRQMRALLAALAAYRLARLPH